MDLGTCPAETYIPVHLFGLGSSESSLLNLASNCPLLRSSQLTPASPSPESLLSITHLPIFPSLLSSDIEYNHQYATLETSRKRFS